MPHLLRIRVNHDVPIHPVTCGYASTRTRLHPTLLTAKPRTAVRFRPPPMSEGAGRRWCFSLLPIRRCRSMAHRWHSSIRTTAYGSGLRRTSGGVDHVVEVVGDGLVPFRRGLLLAQRHVGTCPAGEESICPWPVFSPRFWPPEVPTPTEPVFNVEAHRSSNPSRVNAAGCCLGRVTPVPQGPSRCPTGALSGRRAPWCAECPRR